VGRGLSVLKKIAKKAAPAARAIASRTSTAVKKCPGSKSDRYSRPSGYRRGMRDRVWEMAKGKDGKVRDPLTKKVIRKTDTWDMGHKPGHEFRKHQASAAKRGISRKQFLDEHNVAKKYRPELPSSNRSHAGESRSSKYLGP
jgi:predicted ribonuclease toxin of YeeF-YezG toxin-antitoxin module